MSSSSVSLDNIFTEIGGFGKFQRIVVLLILLAASAINFSALVWVFETKNLNYRCEITGCESDPPQYAPSWWTNAIPSTDNVPSKCEKYKQLTNNSQTICDFDQNVIEYCDRYIYETDEISILRDFNLHCDENLWKLSFAGTMNSIGVLTGLPISGLLSDKIGRKLILIGSVTFSGLCGLIRSFSNSYIFYIIMQYLDSVFRAATYPTCFILAVEFVGPNKRVLIGVLIGICCSLGGVIVGALAWELQTWRTLDQILYGVCLLVFLYYWFLPESIRWLITKKRYTDAEKIIKKIAKTNNATISEEKLKTIWTTNTSLTATIEVLPLRTIFKSGIITKRFILCCISWTICMFCYYGMTFVSVNLSSNSYLDFILTLLVEIPSNVIVYLMIDRIGRRYSLALGFLICGISCLGFIFIPEDLYWLQITIYLLGKFGISFNVTGLYTITSEIFPTPLRSSLLSICSTFGRIGVIVAPQLPLLKLYWKHFPLALFGSTAIAASILSLFLPETMNTVLPDTIEEAANIGKKTTVNNSTLDYSETTSKY